MDRLRLGAKARARNAIANAIAGVAVIDLLGALYFFPNIAIVLLIACLATLIIVCCVVAAILVFNEICWLVSGRRF